MAEQAQDNGAPRVSVIMSVYNGERWLAEAIDSVLTQTFGDFEFLIHDDGSTDRSPAILAEYAARDGRIILSRGENIGLTGVLNLLVGKARGELLARMDADDVCLPTRFERQVAWLDVNTTTVALGGQLVLIDEAGRLLRPLPLPLNHEEIDGVHMTSLNGVLFHPAIMMRAEAIRRIGGYDESREAAQDYDLWLRLAEVGRLANLPEPVLYYRQHLNSTGYAKRHKQLLSIWRALGAACERRGLPFDMPCPKTEAPPSMSDVYKKWGWWALGGGNVGTARLYAWRALAAAPMSREAWRLAACALRGY